MELNELLMETGSIWANVPIVQEGKKGNKH